MAKVKPLPKPKPLMVTATNAAIMLGMSRSTIYRLLANGDLEARKAGDSTMILMSSIEAYCAGLPVFKPDMPAVPLRPHAKPPAARRKVKLAAVS
jgi:excisionase family DNA binding protein